MLCASVKSPKPFSLPFVESARHFDEIDAVLSVELLCVWVASLFSAALLAHRRLVPVQELALVRARPLLLCRKWLYHHVIIARHGAPTTNLSQLIHLCLLRAAPLQRSIRSNGAGAVLLESHCLVVRGVGTDFDILGVLAER